MAMWFHTGPTIVNNKAWITLKPTNKYSDCDIYGFNFSDCVKLYIVETDRSFKTRFKRHFPSKTNEQLVCRTFNRQRTQLQLYTGQHNHFHKMRKGHKINIMEKFEVYKYHKSELNNISNDKLNFTLNCIYDFIFEKQKQTGCWPVIVNKV